MSEINLEVVENNIGLEVIDSGTINSDITQAVVIAKDYYEGTYIVVPNFNEQKLETKEKTMRDDVTVNPIQVERTSNPQGGQTIYIGGNLNG